jgi:hypothetical protein
MEKYAVCAVGELDRSLTECLNQLRVGDECGRVKLHVQTPWDENGDSMAQTPLIGSLVVMVALKGCCGM